MNGGSCFVLQHMPFVILPSSVPSSVEMSGVVHSCLTCIECPCRHADPYRSCPATCRPFRASGSCKGGRGLCTFLSSYRKCALHSSKHPGTQQSALCAASVCLGVPWREHRRCYRRVFLPEAGGGGSEACHGTLHLQGKAEVFKG